MFDYSQSCITSEIGDEDSSEELFEINLKVPLHTITEDLEESSVFSFGYSQ